MKNRTVVLLIALILCASLTALGCSKSYEPHSSYSDAPIHGENAKVDFESSFNSDVHSTYAPSSASDDGKDVLEGRKVIRNADLNVQTKEFDAFIAAVTDRAISYGGYVQSSNVNSRGMYYGGMRYANMVLRIPSDKLDSFLREVDGLGNVISRTENADDVTEQYVDIEARLSAVRTEYQTLLDLLSKAESLEDIITLQDRLSTVRYQIESYEGKLRNYDSLVSFGTVTIDVSEVERETSIDKESFGQEVSRKFKESLEDVGSGFRTFVVWFIGNLPAILIWAVIFAVIIIVIVRITKRSRRKAEERKAKKGVKTVSAQIDSENN